MSLVQKTSVFNCCIDHYFLKDLDMSKKHLLLQVRERFHVLLRVADADMNHRAGGLPDCK